MQICPKKLNINCAAYIMFYRLKHQTATFNCRVFCVGMNNSRIIVTSDGSKQLVTFSKLQQKVVRQNIRSEDEYLDVGS